MFTKITSIKVSNADKLFIAGLALQITGSVVHGEIGTLMKRIGFGMNVVSIGMDIKELFTKPDEATEAI